MDADGHPHFFDPQGRPAKDVPVRILGDDVGWPHIVAANRGLGIEPHVSGWSGERVPYAEVCRALYRLDDGSLTADEVC
jgi:hypothetical protein